MINAISIVIVGFPYRNKHGTFLKVYQIKNLGTSQFDYFFEMIEGKSAPILKKTYAIGGGYCVFGESYFSEILKNNNF